MRLDTDLHRVANAHQLSAVQEAYAFIDNRIRSGVYAAGQRLVADDIAAELSMSRMPVREAFRRLAGDGVIMLRANRGAIVTSLGEQDVREVFEMRAALEGLAAGNAVARIKPSQMRDLELLLERMEEANLEHQTWVTRHREFHEYLTDLAGMPRVSRQIAVLHTVIEPYMRVWVSREVNSMQSKACHEHILEALRTGEREVVEQALRTHVLSTIPPFAGCLPPGV